VRDEVREKSRQWRNEILRKKMPQPVIAKINGWVFAVASRLDRLRHRHRGRRRAIRSIGSFNFAIFPAAK